MTVNEALQDAAVRHSVVLERFERGQLQGIVGFLNQDVLPDIEGNVAARVARVVDAGGFDAGPITTRRLRELKASVAKTASAGFSKVHDTLSGGLLPLAEQEAAWQGSIISKLAPVKLSVALPPVSQLHAVVTDRPFQGALLREHWLTVKAHLVNELDRQIKIGLASGETTDQIVRRVRGTASSKFTDGVFGKTRRQTAATVRSAVAHTSNTARSRLYDSNKDVIKSVQWVAALDARTCPQCMDLDFRIWPVGEGPRPPIHHQCRCTTVPVLKSWRELGIDLNEAPQGTRASMSGQVPARLNYDQWIKAQPAALQDSILGPARGEMLRSGRFDVSHFVSNQGRTLTLGELAEVDRVLLDLSKGRVAREALDPAFRRAAREAGEKAAKILNSGARSGLGDLAKTTAQATKRGAEESARLASMRLSKRYTRKVRLEAKLAGSVVTDNRLANITRLKTLELKPGKTAAERTTLKRLKANEASLRSKVRARLRKQGKLAQADREIAKRGL